MLVWTRAMGNNAFSTVVLGPYPCQRPFVRLYQSLQPQHGSSYDFRRVEAKWQAHWARSPPICASNESSQLKRKREMTLAMFPYPSGRLHMGHVRVYTITDTLSRWKKMQGIHVMQPMGWDAFGLPAENAAILHGIRPSEWTRQNIQTMKAQMKSLSLDIDWSHEISTCEPEYYKWTQWIFLKLFEQGLAYQADGIVNWDPVDKTVLANEQVDEQGRSWRSGALVEKKKLCQWYFKMTAYAHTLEQGLAHLPHWPSKVKDMQANWIHKTQGALISFPLMEAENQRFPELNGKIDIFTTAPEVIHGVTFVAVAPEHPIVNAKYISEPYWSNVQSIMNKTWTEQADICGAETGLVLQHPLLPTTVLPVYVANYVLAETGSGAIMGVPAHSKPDYTLAQQHGLPIVSLLEPSQIDVQGPILLPGTMNTNAILPLSLHGLDSITAKERVMNELQSKHLARPTLNFRLRDWLVSRQRYWGAPIPMIHCPSCKVVPVPEKDLPVVLPDLDFAQMKNCSGNPLEHAKEWGHVNCPKCGGPARRETDTMDTFVDSSWYFLRFANPSNAQELASAESLNAWLPVTTYVGGVEHATSHLLYARFIYKFLQDMHVIPSTRSDEPFDTLLTQGMVHGKTFKCPETGAYLKPSELDTTADGSVPRVKSTNLPAKLVWEKMSKSKFNGVEPQDMLDKYGIDTVRLYILAKAPPEMVLDWNERDIIGQARWISKYWKVTHSFLEESKQLAQPTTAVESTTSVEDARRYLRYRLHATIDDVTFSLTKHAFHNAISYLIKLVNDLHEVPSHPALLLIKWESLTTIAKLLYPMAPHAASEAWQFLTAQDVTCFFGSTTNDPLGLQPWPKANPTYRSAAASVVTVQFNGKMKEKLDFLTAELESCHTDLDFQQLVASQPSIQKRLDGQIVDRVIVIKRKSINFVIR